LSEIHIHEPLDPLDTAMKEGEDAFFESRNESVRLAHDQRFEVGEEPVLPMSIALMQNLF
jgi:hypothetical protein